MNRSLRHHRLPLGLLPDQPNPRLYDRVAEVLRTGHHGRRTEQAYIRWNRRFLLGDKGIKATILRTCVLNRGGPAGQSLRPVAKGSLGGEA